MTDDLAFAVARRDPLFFMHIPKAAGMSLRAYLREQYFGVDVLPAADWAVLLACGRDPADFRLVQGHFQHGMRAALQPGTRVVTTLRDPLRRTASALKHLARDPHFHPDHVRARGLSLSQMLRTPALTAPQRNVQAAALCLDAAG